MRRLFAETVYPQARAAGDEMFLLYYAPDEWGDRIDDLLRDKYPIQAQRQYYVWKGVLPEWRALLPAEFTLHRADAALLEQAHLKNRDALIEEMCSERASVDEFLAKSFGVCLLHEDAIAGWCLSEYNSATGCEVGIATMEPYRRRGLATLMTWALVEIAQARGMTHIGWHCFANNTPSVATARRAGFEKVKDYPVILAWFDETAALAVNGNVRLAQEQYSEALTWFERAFARGDASGWAYWRAACAAAALGENAAALRYLSQAADNGFRDANLIKSSEHLRTLQDGEEWKTLMRRLEAD